MCKYVLPFGGLITWVKDVDICRSILGSFFTLKGQVERFKLRDLTQNISIMQIFILANIVGPPGT